MLWETKETGNGYDLECLERDSWRADMLGLGERRALRLAGKEMNIKSNSSINKSQRPELKNTRLSQGRNEEQQKQ